MKWLEQLNIIPTDDPTTSPAEWLGIYLMLVAAIVGNLYFALTR